ncbi:MAG: putative Permease of the major facilitator superfamily [Burkholderia sp.]|nr:putative Permease of the major facilitator superfamily [Burkholderia sp.]
MPLNEYASRLPSRPAASGWPQAVANPLNFVMLGVVYASWAARVPAVRDSLQLDAASLSIALLGGGAGAVLSFPLAASLIRRLGARRASCCAGLGMLLSLPCIALAPSLPWLTAAVFLFGASTSCFDVAINALGAVTEKAAGRSIMAMLHAWFCAGALAGSLLGSLAAGAGLPVLTHFLLLATPMAALLLVNSRWLPADQPHPSDHAPLYALPHGPLVVLGIIGFCGAMAEGSIGDWSGVYLKDTLNAGDGVAPLAFAGFTGMMLAARLLCDRLKDNYGARRVVAGGALLAMAGLGMAAMAPGLMLTLGGFAMAGAGLAAVFPFVFSAGGRHGPTALAGVATLSYSGSLLGPPVIGAIAHRIGMQAAIGFIAIVCIAIALSASRASALD